MNSLSRASISAIPGFSIFLFSLYLVSHGATIAQANPICSEGVNDLQKSFGIVQAKGGVWGFLEQSSGLKDKSMIGLQLDGKVQRAIVILETACQDGKPPSMEQYKAVESVVGDARMVFNMSGRTPPAKIMEKINSINGRADQILKDLGQ
jgi:hypothetical protein